MFIRPKVTGGHPYAQLVDNYREQGQVKQRVLTTLGRLDRLQQSGQPEAPRRPGARLIE